MQLWLFVYQPAATLVQMSAWMQSWSLEQWHRDVNGFSETDFLENIRMARDILNHNACFLESSQILSDSIRSVSDLDLFL